MADPYSRFDELKEKLDALLRRQEQFQNEINELRSAIELERLKENLEAGLRKKKTAQSQPEEQQTAAFPSTPAPAGKVAQEERPPGIFSKKKFSKTRVEKFIGENLANKIGILIVIIGVTIGVKYVIDNQLISPLMRIVLGYISGLILLGFSYRLKRQYHQFSAVLLSGAMAILYFISFAAHEFYGFIGPLPAFLLLVTITVFTVFEATRFNRQVIAHIGLVGAYAVPFLVGKDPGQAQVLFTYMAIINAGVLLVAVQRYWKPLYYLAFLLTWLIFATWYIEDYSPAEDFRLGMTFSGVFFALFYITFLAYKLIKGQKFGFDDVLLLLSNAFIFYILGYLMLEDIPGGKDYQGAFSVANAAVHFVVSALIHRFRNFDRELFLLVTGLALLFVTIAIPVQFDGRAVTLLWAGEAVLLFWLGRSRKARVYEWLSYPVILLTIGSLLHDWTVFYVRSLMSSEVAALPAPFLNVQLLTSIIVVVAFGSMALLNARQKAEDIRNGVLVVLDYFLPIAFVLLLFSSFFQEIGYFWQIKILSLGAVEAGQAEKLQAADFLNIGNAWKVNYTLFFLALLSFVNIYWFKDQLSGMANLALNLVGLLIFLTVGLYELDRLWDNYFDQHAVEYYHPGSIHIWLRYLSYVFVGLLLFANRTYLRKMSELSNMGVLSDLFFHLTLLWIVSTELVQWLEVMGSGASDRLVLSILWGLYAFLLIGLGIWKKKAYLRIAAMVLFALTLIKLFFYDLVDLDSVSKTIIFVSLGSLLLVISFLYNKYRHSIFDDHDTPEEG